MRRATSPVGRESPLAAPHRDGYFRFLPSCAPCSMVIDNLHLVRPTVPDETDPPLVIDPNAILPRPLPLKGLQAIAGRPLQRVQTGSGMQLAKLAPGAPLDLGREGPRDLIIEDTLCLAASE